MKAVFLANYTNPATTFNTPQKLSEKLATSTLESKDRLIHLKIMAINGYDFLSWSVSSSPTNLGADAAVLYS